MWSIAIGVLFGKFAMVEHRRQHARRVRYPEADVPPEPLRR
jgi:hypothetical protein